MDLKNLMGIANVVAIFNELTPEAKQVVINDLVNSGDIPSIKWQDAVKTKPEPYVKVYAKGGFKMEPLPDMVTWTGDKWVYVESAEELNWSVTHFVIPG